MQYIERKIDSLNLLAIKELKDYVNNDDEAEEHIIKLKI